MNIIKNNKNIKNNKIKMKLLQLAMIVGTAAALTGTSC